MLTSVLIALPFLLFFIVSTYHMLTERKRFVELAADMRENPPMMKCPAEGCGLTVLGSSQIDREIHMLCILDAQAAVERRAQEKMLEEAHYLNRTIDSQRAAERKALEAPKKPVFKREITPIIKKDLGAYDNVRDWMKDIDSGYYTRYDWIAYKDGAVIGNGHKRYESDAITAAKAVIKVFKKQDSVVVD